MECYILNAFLRDPICAKSLAQLTTSDFAEYRNKRLETISARSLSRQLSPLRHMFKVAALEWKVPISDPLKQLALKATRRSRERRLRAGEFESLFHAAQKCRNPLLWRVIVLSLETAMRRSETLNFVNGMTSNWSVGA